MLSNSCTLWNQRGRRVLLRLWLILLQPSPWREGDISPLFSPLAAELRNWVSSRLLMDKFTPPSLACPLWPRSAPGHDAHARTSDHPDSGPSPTGWLMEKKEGGTERARFFWTLFSLGWNVLWNKQYGCCMVSPKPSGHLLKKVRPTNSRGPQGEGREVQNGEFRKA